MTPVELERANTWLIEIVDALIDGVQWRQEGNEHHAVGQGGLRINTLKGCWFQHSTSKGGCSAISLVKLLKGYDDAVATEWLDIFLRAHPGTGSITDPEDNEHEIESAAQAQDIIDKLVDPVGTPAETYLRLRGIAGPLPEFVKYLPNARCGEGAIAGLLKARNRIVGVQVGYLDPNGCKTVVRPYRRRFMLEKAPDAVFETVKSNSATDLLGDTLVTEGLEDALSLVELGRSVRVVGLPGIGTLQHLPVKKGERIIVVRDGDAPGSGADKGLIAGVDHLLLEGATVKATHTPAGADANSILQDSGKAALQQLLADTYPGDLSRDGEITRLSRLDRLDYDAERKPAAERLGIRISTLDQEVARRRPKMQGPAGASEDADGQGRPITVPPVEPWPELVEGRSLLDDIAAGLRRYLILEEHQRVATALWVVFSHAFDSFETAPKLVLKSPQKRSGKTRSLEVLMRLVAKPLETSSITAAALLRIIERCGPTLLLDEFDTMMTGGSEIAETLRGLLNSGFNRAFARMIKSVPLPGGGWEEREFSTWSAQVLAGIGRLPDTVADRSIQIEMKRKKRGEVIHRLRSRDGNELRLLARKAARWATDHAIELAAADPETPLQLNDRAADAWAPLLAIADAAGGAWPERARQAAILLSGGEIAETVGTMLLSDIRDAFAAKEAKLKAEAQTEAQAEAAIKLAGKMSSDELVGVLLNLEDRPWAEINRSRPLTKNGLAFRLKAFHISPGSVQMGVGKGAPTPKGYKLDQFTDVFDRYLPPVPPQTDDLNARPPDPAETKSFPADPETPDVGVSGGLTTAKNPSNSALSGGLASENPKKGEVVNNIPVTGIPRRRPSAGAEPNGHTAPNGHDGPAEPNALHAAIIAYARDNPKKSMAAIAKDFGQPQEAVETLLQGIDR